MRDFFDDFLWKIRDFSNMIKEDFLPLCGILGGFIGVAFLSSLLWDGVAYYAGPPNHSSYADPKSFILLVCKWLTLFLVLIFGVSLFELIKERKRDWKHYAGVIGSVALLLPSVFYIINDISSARENYFNSTQSFMNWEDSVYKSINTIPEDSKQSSVGLWPDDRIWMMINGRFINNDKDELLLKTQEERTIVVQSIALIDESYQETGMQYAADRFLYKQGTGIRAVKYTWHVSIRDLKGRHVLAEKVFIGPEPPKTISINTITEDVFGIRPIIEYKAWLKTLTAK